MSLAITQKLAFRRYINWIPASD